MFEPSPRLCVTSLGLRPPICSNRILPSHWLTFQPKDWTALWGLNTLLQNVFTSIYFLLAEEWSHSRPAPRVHLTTGLSELLNSCQTESSQAPPSKKGKQPAGEGNLLLCGRSSFMAKTLSSLHGMAWYLPT